MFDRQTGATTRVSVASDGTEANGGSNDNIPTISADGRFVTYFSEASNLVPGDTNNAGDIFVFDRQTGTTTRVSVASDGTEGNNSSFQSDISADGRFVTYTSHASNLVPGDTNNTCDIFVFDRQTSTTTRVSVASDGTEANSGSVAVLLRFRRMAALWPTSAMPRTWSLAIPTALTDIFVFDRQTNTTERVSVASDGTEATGSTSEALVPRSRQTAAL